MAKKKFIVVVDVEDGTVEDVTAVDFATYLGMATPWPGKVDHQGSFSVTAFSVFDGQVARAGITVQQLLDLAQDDPCSDA